MVIGSKKYYGINSPALYARVCLLQPESGEDCISIYMKPAFPTEIKHSHMLLAYHPMLVAKK